MQQLSIEIVNVDEDIAEQAVNTLVDALTLIVDPIKKSLKVEPHDETRGVWASFELKEHAMSSSTSYKKAVVSAAKSIVELQFHNISKANVYVTMTDNK
jgi:hypothetical protein